MIVYKGQGINWHPQSDSLGVSPLKQTQSTHPLVSGLCSLVESLRKLTCFIGCFSATVPSLLSFQWHGWCHCAVAVVVEAVVMVVVVVTCHHHCFGGTGGAVVVILQWW